MGMTSGILIDSGKLLCSISQQRVPLYRTERNMATDTPTDKTANVSNYSTLKIHMKMLVCSTALPTIT